MPFVIILMKVLELFNTLKGMLMLMCFKLYTFQKAEFNGIMKKTRIKQWYICFSEKKIDLTILIKIFIRKCIQIAKSIDKDNGGVDQCKICVQ